MYLGLRTDSAIAEIYLFKNKNKVAHTSWQADRELAKHLLGKLEDFLNENDTTFNDLTGLFVYLGPGSFTGLRIGLTVMNTAAYALSLPIVGSTGDKWLDECMQKLINNQNEKAILPLYGADHITKAKK
jgi:tRNA threonylcarbamoyladenosine biosynthesis protein TsaB